MVLTVRTRDAERCALCHDALAEDHDTCAVCGTCIDGACRRELGRRRCPTLGCTGTLRSEPRARRPIRRLAAEPVDTGAARLRSFTRGLVVGLVLSLAAISTMLLIAYVVR